MLVPTPLLTAEIPDWIALHFVIDPTFGWRSPLVLDAALANRLRSAPTHLALDNVTPRRAERLHELNEQYSVDEILQRFGLPRTQPPPQRVAQSRGQPAPQQAGPMMQNSATEQWLEAEFAKRQAQQKELRNEGRGLESKDGNFLNVPMPGKSALWDAIPGGGFAATCVATQVTEMAPHWLTGRDGHDRLLLIRNVRTETLLALQGLYLDWPRLREILLAEVADLIPNAQLEPINGDTGGDRMTALPIRLVAAPPMVSFTNLISRMRWELGLAWGAAALALLVVGYAGWSLLDLSERRFRFVTAVTHELRTPLTSMRLFLDMLTTGMVRSEKDRDDYLQLLTQDTDRLNRLIGNVLDFARLERQKVATVKRTLPLGDFIASVHADWESRCKSAGKELVVELGPQLPTNITTDPDLCKQVLGNLIDNACKYSQGCDDARIWLRAERHNDDIVFEVEDRGPGVSQRESTSIFQPFQRGKKACETAGGIGLGLALANRWAKILGGQLELHNGRPRGARFQFRLPIHA
jgi:signal transduction histidine kinase